MRRLLLIFSLATGLAGCGLHPAPPGSWNGSSVVPGIPDGGLQPLTDNPQGPFGPP